MPLPYPWSISVDEGQVLELRFQQYQGNASTWTSPRSSDSEVVSFIRSTDRNGWLVADYRATKLGTSNLSTGFPCSGTGCAAALFRLHVQVVTG